MEKLNSVAGGRKNLEVTIGNFEKPFKIEVGTKSVQLTTEVDQLPPDVIYYLRLFNGATIEGIPQFEGIYYLITHRELPQTDESKPIKLEAITGEGIIALAKQKRYKFTPLITILSENTMKPLRNYIPTEDFLEADVPGHQKQMTFFRKATRSPSVTS